MTQQPNGSFLTGDDVFVLGLEDGVTIAARSSFQDHVGWEIADLQILSVLSDPARVEVLTQSSLQVWEAIQAGNFYPNPTPQNCTTCPFKSKCPVFAGAD